jgi:hypothetical protein
LIVTLPPPANRGTVKRFAHLSGARSIDGSPCLVETQTLIGLLEITEIKNTPHLTFTIAYNVLILTLLFLPNRLRAVAGIFGKS